ncbi:MAG: carbohydrate-binding module family 20 domain-containing protein [Ignavibacteriaceae bacterium]|nr:carbohydrate-binding module family 20 domain-containing protein [Ignavibacteriaceae bacterium]
MKKYLLCFSFPIFLAFTFCSQNNVNITIEVIADNLPEGSKIYITGNDDQMGNWQPDSIELIEIEKGKWSKSFSFIKGKKLEFKITRGSWNTEALSNDGAVPDNYFVEILNDTTIEIKITLWADQVERKLSRGDAYGKGQITGIVKYHRNFQGEGIKPRDIIVWLPPGYESDLNNNYPVLYMHDGQNIVDPVHICISG